MNLTAIGTLAIMAVVDLGVWALRRARPGGGAGPAVRYCAPVTTVTKQ